MPLANIVVTKCSDSSETPARAMWLDVAAEPGLGIEGFGTRVTRICTHPNPESRIPNPVLYLDERVAGRVVAFVAPLVFVVGLLGLAFTSGFGGAGNEAFGGWTLVTFFTPAA